MSVAYLRQVISFRAANSAEGLYDFMASQSAYQLPILYQPFDPHQRGHFVDRAQTYDFAMHAGGGRILDFGPGDGWPSLLMAPYVREVVGVDGSARRVDICRENARRLGVSNTSFAHVPPGHPLPFPEASFDAVAAGSSIEQTPDHRYAVDELLRVLKPGGRLRMQYESLGYYRGGAEQYLSACDLGDGRTRLLVIDRHIDEEYADNFHLFLALPYSEVTAIFARHGPSLNASGLTPAVIDALCSAVTDAIYWHTDHPSGATWLRLLREAGFGEATATYDGGWFAGRLFEHLGEERLPHTLEETDHLLHPLVEVVVTMKTDPTAPAGEFDRWITAVK